VCVCVCVCLYSDVNSSCMWNYNPVIKMICRSQWPRGHRRGSAVGRLVWLRVRISPRMFVTYDYSVLQISGLCVGLITSVDASYRVCVCVCVCVWMCFWSLDKGKPWSNRCCCAKNKFIYMYIFFKIHIFLNHPFLSYIILHLFKSKNV
jgi:hypothetical protein